MYLDIIYEIIRYLYLCPEENGGAIMAKKIMLSRKKHSELDERIYTMEKPIVFDIAGDSVKLWYVPEEIDVYWGDDVVEHTKNTLQILRHRYSCDKSRTIKIFNHPKDINFLAPDNTVNFHSIGNLTVLNNMLDGCSLLTFTGEKWDTSEVTDMTELFAECPSLNGPIGRNWDVSNVDNMMGMFRLCDKLTYNIGKNWVTSSLRSTRLMFGHCDSLNKNVGCNWDTSGVTDMSGMFWECYKLNKSIGEKWNTSSVTTMADMFGFCRSLNRPIGKEWNISNVTDFSCMFYSCDKYNESWNSHWGIPKTVDTNAMFGWEA